MSGISNPPTEPIVIRLERLLDEDRGKSSDPREYLVAGRTLIANRPLMELSPFELERTAQARPWECLEKSGEFDRSASPVFDGQGWVGGQLVHLLCRSFEDHFELAVDGAGVFLVGRRGDRIIERSVAAEDLAVQTLVGPCLALALALQEIFCLHASAIARDDHVVVFVGPTGAGKSTLARTAPGVQGGWRRVADDSLAVSMGEQVEARPHFPQLKLSSGNQWPVEAPATMAIAAIFDLVPGERSDDRIGLRQLSVREAALSLVRHTIAGRLFDRELRVTHLTHCASLVAGVPVFELDYPRTFESIPEILNRIGSKGLLPG